MGLIRAAQDAVNSLLADQWKEFFYCDSLDSDVLMVKGQIRAKEGTNKRTDNIISNGSVIAVNEGQCMLLAKWWISARSPGSLFMTLLPSLPCFTVNWERI